MDFYTKLMTLHGCGKLTVVKDKDNQYCIFSTPDLDGNLRHSGWYSPIGECLERIGTNSGHSEADIEKYSKDFSWQIVKTIDFCELGGSGYKKGEKVRILPNAKEECEKRDIVFASSMEKMMKDGIGYFEGLNGADYTIWDKDKSDWWTFSRTSIEPFLDDEITEITMDEIAARFNVDVKNLKIKK